jgi:ABC-type sulfate transport system permease component
VLVLVLVALREAGVDLPASVPESLVVIALGSLATIFALIRLISIPDDFFFAGRAVGIWITLVAAVALIVAGLLEASEEL